MEINILYISIRIGGDYNYKNNSIYFNFFCRQKVCDSKIIKKSKKTNNECITIK